VLLSGDAQGASPSRMLQVPMDLARRVRQDSVSRREALALVGALAAMRGAGALSGRRGASLCRGSKAAGGRGPSPWATPNT